MKKKYVLYTLVLAALSSFSVCSAQCPSQKGGLVPPAAINVPFGGKIVTEINISDSNVLGIIKEAIPALDEAMKESCQKNPKASDQISAIASKIDLKGLSDSISGIKSVRILVVHMGRNVSSTELLKELDKGVEKTGCFSKILSDTALISSSGVFALYAEPNNAGYVGYAYEPYTGMLYAGRVVGFLDVKKATQWGWKLAEMFVIQNSEYESKSENTDSDSETHNNPAPSPEPSPAPGN